jgi:hypothetical protein
MIKYNYFIRLSSIIFFLFFPIAFLRAATFTLQSAKEEYGLGDEFAVVIKLDPDEKCINAVATTVKFDKNFLIFSNFTAGDSIVSVWLDTPQKADFEKINAEGAVHFAGGMPGGYCGKIPGDPGESNILAKLIFRTPGFYVGKTPDALDIIMQDDAQALINDGLGTPDKVNIVNLHLGIVSEQNSEKEQAGQIIRQDTVPPEPFMVELIKKDDIYQGKYFIIFDTVDKQTGVDHYEVIEYLPDQKNDKEWWKKIADYILQEETPAWSTAVTPHLLKDQNLRSIIKVKAVDKAGNERFVEYIPKIHLDAIEWKYVYFYTGVFVILLIIITLLVYLLIFKKKKLTHNN